MSTSGYETILQLRDSFLQRIIDEERQRPNSPFLQTFDEIPPTTVGDIEITETVVNVARGSIALETLPAQNSVRLVFQAAEVQLTFGSPTAPSALLYDLLADIGITGALASVTDNDLIQVGLATNDVAVNAEITNGNPFDDDDFLIEAINSQLQAAFASGSFPTNESREDQDFGLFTADIFVEVENDVGGDPSRQIRASFTGSNQIAVIFPIHLRWTNIQSLLSLEPSLAVLSEIVLTAPLTRQMNNSPAFVEIDFNASTVTTQNTQAIEGEANLAEPGVQLVVDQTLLAIGQEIASTAGTQRFDALTLSEINELVAGLVETSLEANGQLVPFWSRKQDDSFQDATPLVLDGVIAIAINAGPDADPMGIELFLPEDQDCAVFFGADLFLTEVETFLYTPIAYDDASDGARVDGGGQTGTTLAITGLANPTGTIRERTQFTIQDVEGIYTVAEDAAIEENRTTLTLTSPLTQSPEAGAQVNFKFGFGLPNRRFDAGGINREVQIDDLTPSLQDGFFQLRGPITILRPAAVVFKKIDGTVTIRTRFKWVDEVSRTARVNGEGQGGIQLVVDGFDPETSTISRGTSFAIDGVAGIYELIQGAVVSDNAATLEIDTALSSSPGNDAQVRFLTRRQVIEQELIGDPDIDLASGPAGILAAILGVVLTIFTGGLFAGLITTAVIFIVKAIIEIIAGKKSGDVVGNSLDTTPLPDTLATIFVDIKSRFSNPLEISPQGILFAGLGKPTSRFADLDDSQARAGGPYEAIAGSPLQFNGGLIANETDYEWLTGDSLTSLTGRTPVFTYAALAYRVAALTTINRQFEDGSTVQNRHLALVRVRNTVPELEPITPIQAFEGEEIEVLAHFSDRSWADTHTAYVLFGDRTAPEIATVVETNDPPAAMGTITARHTYCDNGQFTIAVKVIDENGGSQTAITTAVIRNVPPLVEAGSDRFAYLCVPTRLVGRFEDPGWCDTHTATWDFGDCSPLFPATVEETNAPPKGIGTATGTHCYQICGVFVAELTVIDDDGGIGVDTLVVRVVDLRNGNFEGGFHQNTFGQVANHWNAYSRSDSTAVDTSPAFACEHCVVYDGQRSQAILRQAQQVAGIYQQVGANLGWEYQFSAAVQLASGGGGRIRLGIDPAGGGDPDAAAIVWTETRVTDDWVILAVRANAVANAVTVFLEACELLSPAAYLDHVAMKVYPCPPAPEPEEPEIEEQCIDWGRLDPLPLLDVETTINDITFTSLDGFSLRYVQFGLPQGRTQLFIPILGGLQASWVDPAIAVEVTTWGLAAIELSAFDANGNIIATDISQVTTNELRVLMVQANAIRAVRFRVGARSTLSRICIRRKTQARLNNTYTIPDL